jgi:hypothetical protein
MSPFVMHAFLAPTKYTHNQALLFPFLKTEQILNLKAETLNPSMLCKASKGFSG